MLDSLVSVEMEVPSDAVDHLYANIPPDAYRKNPDVRAAVKKLQEALVWTPTASLNGSGGPRKAFVRNSIRLDGNGFVKRRSLTLLGLGL